MLQRTTSLQNGGGDLPAFLKETPAEQPNQNLTGKTVIIVEDEGITQMQLRRTLKTAGLVVVGSATSGEKGVEAVLKNRPDMVLMDIQMPGAYDGLEAARRI